MDLSKSFEFFNPSTIKKDWIHVIGNGSVGSTVAELLARHGIEKMILYDFDVVEPRNIVNQMFVQKHVGIKKVDALKEMLLEINPEMEIRTYSEGWNGQPLDGYVFLAVDNIELRAHIVKENMYNNFVKAMFDFRTGLTDAEHFAADWSIFNERKIFLNSMNYTHEEAKKNAPVSACNVELCVAPTVRMVCNVGVANFINFVKGLHLHRIIPINAFDFRVEAVG